jgi:hypothetical protein
MNENENMDPEVMADLDAILEHAYAGTPVDLNWLAGFGNDPKRFRRHCETNTGSLTSRLT